MDDEVKPFVSENSMSREELRTLVLSALQAAAEGAALVPAKRGTYKLADGTTTIRRN